MLNTRKITLAAPAFVLAVLFAAAGAHAATFTVDTTTDSVDANPGNGICASSGGQCSLRAAIIEANALAGADVISLPAGIYQLTIPGTGEDVSATGDLDIRTDITINATDARTTFIQAGGSASSGIDRVFDIPVTTGVLNLNNATVRFGTDSSGLGGGGLQAVGAGATINLNNVIVTQNSTTANGGGVRNNAGTTSINNSVISNNSTATGFGGAIISNSAGVLRITNSTISGNSANSGGALRNTAGTTTTITNSTIAANSATGGPGGINSSGTMNIRNTIVSGNTGTTDQDFAGAVTSGGTNLIGVQGTSTGWVGSDLLNNANARLAPLGDYGGTTPTYSLLSGSAAINAGQNCVNNSSCATFNAPVNVSVDQRGFGRPASATTDIGAFELPASPNDFTAVLPSGRQNQAYTATIAANTTFGPTTFTYSLFGGDTLPAGLSLTTAGSAQNISGTPTVSGVFFFRIQASDGANTQVTRYQLNILVPSAASVSVSGRVLDSNGRGLGKATVVMTFLDGSARTVLTNPFGYYRFDDVAAGQAVVLNVRSKSGTFLTRLILVSDDVTDLDLWALK